MNNFAQCVLQVVLCMVLWSKDQRKGFTSNVGDFLHENNFNHNSYNCPMCMCSWWRLLGRLNNVIINISYNLLNQCLTLLFYPKCALTYSNWTIFKQYCKYVIINILGRGILGLANIFWDKLYFAKKVKKPYL